MSIGTCKFYLNELHRQPLLFDIFRSKQNKIGQLTLDFVINIIAQKLLLETNYYYHQIVGFGFYSKNSGNL